MNEWRPQMQCLYGGQSPRCAATFAIQRWLYSSWMYMNSSRRALAINYIWMAARGYIKALMDNIYTRTNAQDHVVYLWNFANSSGRGNFSHLL